MSKIKKEEKEYITKYVEDFDENEEDEEEDDETIERKLIQATYDGNSKKVKKILKKLDKSQQHFFRGIFRDRLNIQEKEYGNKLSDETIDEMRTEHIIALYVKRNQESAKSEYTKKAEKMIDQGLKFLEMGVKFFLGRKIDIITMFNDEAELKQLLINYITDYITPKNASSIGKPSLISLFGAFAAKVFMKIFLSSITSRNNTIKDSDIKNLGESLDITKRIDYPTNDIKIEPINTLHNKSNKKDIVMNNNTIIDDENTRLLSLDDFRDNKKQEETNKVEVSSLAEFGLDFVE